MSIRSKIISQAAKIIALSDMIEVCADFGRIE